MNYRNIFQLLKNIGTKLHQRDKSGN